MESETIHNLTKNNEAMVFDHSSIESHPDEILSKIFEYLPIINLVAVGRVSKRVERVTKAINGKVKTLMITRDDKRPDWQFNNFVMFCAIEDHKFGDNWICSPNLQNISDIVKALPNLKALDVTSLANDTDLMPNLEQFPVMSNLEHIRFGDELRVSSIDFAIDRLQTSKVTCIWEDNNYRSDAAQIASLTSLKYLKMFSPLDINHARSLLQMNVISLDLRDMLPDTLDPFWRMLFENGSALEGYTLEELAVDTSDTDMTSDHLRHVIDGGLPSLKRIVFSGSITDLENVLRLPNIETVDWSESDGEEFTTDNQLRSTLLTNGKKMKFFKTRISDNTYDQGFEYLALKAIAETCPNLEHLDLQFASNGTSPTSKDLLELQLGQLLPRLRYLEMELSKCDRLEIYQLFKRMSSLIGFEAVFQSDRDANAFNCNMTLERRGDRIVDTVDDSEVMPPAPQAN